MKLSEKIINELEFKTKKNSFLVSSMEKMKYHDLLNFSNIIDNPKFLNEYSSGWNASHYAVLNSNVEVLYFIANLYIKNNCDLNQQIQRAKNGSLLGSSTLDIAIYNQKLEQYIILKSFNIKDNENFSYFLNLQKRRNNLSELENVNLNLPYEFSLANLFLFNFQNVGLKLFNKDFDYDEKPQITKEFLANHKYLSEHYIDNPCYQTYNKFFSDLLQNKNNIDFNLFDFFSLPLIESFKIHKEKIPYDYINNFNKIYENNPSEFLDNLRTSEYKEEMITTFLSMKELMKTDNTEKNYKSIRNFFEKYQIDKLIFSMELSKKLVNKNIPSKINKI